MVHGDLTRQHPVETTLKLAGPVDAAAAAELGRNPVISSHQIQPECGDEQADAGRDGRTRLARPNFQARTGTGKNAIFPCLADHEQDWQPYPVDPCSCNM